MPSLIVQIVRFVDDHQPGWVGCAFLDANGRRHCFEEKAPVVAGDYLDAESKYPQPGVVDCEVLQIWTDEQGRRRVRISTEHPWDIESSEGLNEFVVFAEQLASSGEAT